MKRAIRLYEDFHSYEPKDIREFDRRFRMPTAVCLAGAAEHVLYRSSKIDPATGQKPSGPVDYIHEHDEGVRVYLTTETGAKPRSVPGWIGGCTEFVRLGKCLGFAYRERGGEVVEGHASSPYPDLYAIPSGRALLVIQSRRTVLAMIWGGRLGVEHRGIVH